jgi:hypothetical protein
MRKVPQPQQFVMIKIAATAIVMWISTVAMVIPQAAYAQQDEINPPLSSSSADGCASDQLPAGINGRIQCIRQGECISQQFEGKEVKHCNFMMSGGGN